MKIAIQKREKEKAQQLLSHNLIPAIIYGQKVKNEKIAIDRKIFKEILSKVGETTLFDVGLGEKIYHVLIYEIQRDPLSMEPIHVDFYVPRLDIEIKAKVPLIFENEAPAVKALGGILIKSMHEVEVQALPADLPRELRVSLVRLEHLGDTLYVKDIELPKKVKFAVEENTPIASVVEPRKEEIIAPTPAVTEVIPPPTEREVKVAEKTKAAEVQGGGEQKK